MRKYKYQKIEKYNKCVLVIEYVYDGVKIIECNVYPVVRLTHYRYMLNHRLTRISDWVTEEILLGTRAIDIPSKLAINTLRDDYAHHIFINYDYGCASIMENGNMYHYNDARDSFRVIGLQDRIANNCIYKVKASGEWMQVPVPNKMSLNRLNKTKPGRFHQLLHMFE